MLEGLTQALASQLATGDPEELKADALRGAGNFVKGAGAGLAGMPVDLASALMRPFGYDTPPEQVVGSSDWFGQLMSADPGSLAFMAGTIGSPDPLDWLKAGGLMSAAVARADNLPMDEASRMARAREQGYEPDEPYWHGSTHDIEEWAGPYEMEDFGTGNYMGKANYATSSAEDASRNYSSRTAPDITTRIEMAKEGIADNIEYDPDLTDALLARFGKGLDEDELADIGDLVSDLEGTTAYDDWLTEMATEEVAGPNLGVMYPLMVKRSVVKRTDEPILTGETRDWDDYMAEARKENPGADDSAIEDFAVQLKDSDMEPQLLQLDDAMRSTFDENEIIMDGEDADYAVQSLFEKYFDNESITFDDIQESIDDLTGWDADGHMVSARALAVQVAEKLGVRGIDMDASRAFPSMGLEPGTRHVVTRDPTVFRSVNAKFDPEKTWSPNMLATHPAAAVIGGGAVASMFMEEDEDGT
jgi:hypothetical protein